MLQYEEKSNTKPIHTWITQLNFVHSLKKQLIDLKKEGYTDAFMDQVQPHIKISDWWAFTQTPTVS